MNDKVFKIKESIHNELSRNLCLYDGEGKAWHFLLGANKDGIVVDFIQVRTNGGCGDFGSLSTERLTDAYLYLSNKGLTIIGLARTGYYLNNSLLRCDDIGGYGFEEGVIASYRIEAKDDNEYSFYAQYMYNDYVLMCNLCGYEEEECQCCEDCEEKTEYEKNKDIEDNCNPCEDCDRYFYEEPVQSDMEYIIIPDEEIQ